MARCIKGAVLAVMAASTAWAEPPAAMVTDYDLGKPCRYYLIRHLPAPAHCLKDFLGSWGPGAYVDGEFLFRSRDEWLKWRDRDDYRHWRKHEFSWSTSEPASSAVPPPPAASQAAASAVAATPAAGTSSVLCPAQIAVKLVPSDAMALSGASWSVNQGDGTMRLDAGNPPEVSGANLVCHYRLAGETKPVALYQSAGQRHCVVRADATGFDCSK